MEERADTRNSYQRSNKKRRQKNGGQTKKRPPVIDAVVLRADFVALLF